MAIREWKEWFQGWPILKGGPVVDKGGPGSGHHGHAGRPGQRGGSAAAGAYLALPKAARRQARIDLMDIQKHGIKSNKELATAIDKDGNRIDGVAEGDDRSCNIEKLTSGEEHIILHNHPSNTSFSPPDVALLFRTKAQHLLVVGHDGTVYRLSRTPDSATFSARTEMGRLLEVKSRWKQSIRKNENRFRLRVSSGEMSSRAAWKEHNHLVIQDLAKAFRLDYERILPS